jgi:methylated-DNA-[protein]-cysteine S-methyltransferase
VLKTTVIRPTPLGAVAVVWSVRAAEPVVAAILLSHPDEPADARAARHFAAAREGTCPRIDALCSAIQAFLGGARVKIPTAMLDFSRCAPFQRKVLRAQCAVEYGCVATYGQLAARAGFPGAARAAGNALAANPFPLAVPCHRTVRADGSHGGFQGGAALKRALLDLERTACAAGGVMPVKNYN